jgi:predicted permease
MVESLMLGLLGGAAGLLVARTTLGAMAAILPAVASQTFSVHLDGRVITFTAVVAIATTLLFGLFPALYATRPSLISALREQGGQPSGGRLASRWRTGLATAQVALAMALLGSAGLFAKSLRNISQVDLGVQVEHVLTFGISPSLNGYDSIRSQLFYQRLTEELHRLPGVTEVSAAMVPLLGGSNWGNDVHVEGYDRGPDVDNNSRFNEVGPAYFATVGEPVLLGREFNETDVLGAPKVAIVNQTFAKKFKLGANPVGRRMDMGNDSLDVAIVGMVKDAKYSDVKDEVPPLFFVPYRQDAQAGSLNFLVRTSQDPAKLLASVPRVVARLDKNLPVEDLRTMPEQIRQNIFLDRFISIFTLAFALLATTLAAVGLYGVLAYTVTQRTREIGVRMALGAEPTRVRLMVLRQVGRMMLVGGVIGIAAAIGLGRLAGSLLYQMSGWDPVVLLVSACLLSLVAAAAGLIPANRAARLDPVRALRYE